MLLPIVGFHMTSLKFKLKTIDPTEILLSRCITAAETNFQTNFRFKMVLEFVIEYQDREVQRLLQSRF